jgi:hypothetical protein
MATPVQGNRERRSAVRYPLELPVVVLDEGNQAEIHGVTRDVSAKGVFFWVGYWSPKAGEFRFKMIFPAEITHAEGARAICRGRTVRIESPSTPGRTGIAAIIDVVKLGM